MFVREFKRYSISGKKAGSVPGAQPAVAGCCTPRFPPVYVPKAKMLRLRILQRYLPTNYCKRAAVECRQKATVLKIQYGFSLSLFWY